MTAAVYYVSTCPDTGRQFLVREGRDDNLIELSPMNVAKLVVLDDLFDACKATIKWADAGEETYFDDLAREAIKRVKRERRKL